MSQSLQDESQTNPTTPLHLHAELLPNIRQLTLYISVPPKTPRSNLQITLSDSRRAVTVTSSLPNTNQDDPTSTSETIKLPARVSESSRRILQQRPPSTQGESEYSFRMQVDDNDTSLHKDETTLNDGFIPWTATDMSAHTRLRCVKCHNPIMEGEPTILTCTTCTTQLGLPDPIANGYRLFKTSLSANTTSSSEDNNPPEETWESHPPETILTAQLLELIERESYRRFVIHCGAKDGLLIWPFNPSLRYSTTSASHSTAAQLAMKVFYQHVDNVEEILHPEVGKGNQSLAIEEVRLPGEQAYRELVGVLEERNAMLPASARVFREWRVGLLWRFERKQ
ncbi:hypothetical protein CBS115989_7434 [Aspergillus niger]|nr:hypothetical protein CBS115989_7434 [Aspergillus niger]KAI2839809.1 hypothetical protein CBS11232_9280 [Aspergillus niger]KAI2871491.1 hypothetical protein CBS115988_8555 [Aspergillus niger]